MDTVNIAVIIKTRELSGTQKRSAKIAVALNERGHSTTLFLDAPTHRALTKQNYSFDWPPIVIWSYPIWVRALGLGKKKGVQLRAALGLDRIELSARKRFWSSLFRKHQIDVAHLYIKWRMCEEISIPHIFEITSPDIARKIANHDNPFPPETVLHPNSEGVASALEKAELKNKTVVAPHAYFDPNEPAGFKLPAKENLVVFAHRLIPRKNPIIFAKAAKRFLKSRPDWKVAIRGSGPLADDVSDILSEEVLLGNALIGFDPNLMQELYRSRIFVSIESEDNYSNQSVLEAMWCRNALVMSDRGRSRARYFADNGVLCEPEEDSVFQALIALANEPQNLDWMAQNSQRLIENAYSRSDYLDHLEQIYDSVLDDRSYRRSRVDGSHQASSR